MYADFMFVAMDQLVNQIANARYVSEGRWTAPLVVRAQQGTSPGACAQHSHSIETYLVHTPGLWVAVPATADDAYRSNRAPQSTATTRSWSVEARTLYPSAGPVDLRQRVQPMGGASRRPRRSATSRSSTWSTGVPLCLAAADQLAADGADVEVVDLRWLNPLDMDTVMALLSTPRPAGRPWSTRRTSPAGSAARSGASDGVTRVAARFYSSGCHTGCPDACCSDPAGRRPSGRGQGGVDGSAPAREETNCHCERRLPDVLGIVGPAGTR